MNGVYLEAGASLRTRGAPYSRFPFLCAFAITLTIIPLAGICGKLESQPLPVSHTLSVHNFNHSTISWYLWEGGYNIDPATSHTATV